MADEEVKEVNGDAHKTAHPTKRRGRKNRKVEGYRRRNRLIEIIIVCVLAIFLFILACNKTFLKTNYTTKIDGRNISIDLPRFTYYVGRDDKKIIFKTIKKSTNTRKFFEDYLEGETTPFSVYYCGDKTYYYNREQQFVIYSIDVTKKIAVKTITVNYAIVDENHVCGNDDKVIEQNQDETNDEL